jgi:hypothetical protein
MYINVAAAYFVDCHAWPSLLASATCAAPSTAAAFIKLGAAAALVTSC